ncbi:MAG: preprotein translocase subunit SecG [Elusimicrobia bacterium RIFOXYA2_FULL_39_19]|nr:MAG: preprotein translocase subunit SecG [Elusimicrobia bacterium RIFOXYA2_FULL_39_19]
MYTIFLIFNVAAALLLVLIILLQSGKAGGIGGVLGGGGGSEQLFNTPSGSDFLRKVTVVLAVIFFVSTIGLTFFGYRNQLKTVTGQLVQTAPANPAPVAPAAQ